MLGTVVEDRVLRVGDARLPDAQMLIRDEIGTMAGLIGTDVLCRPVLAVSADRCRPVWPQVPSDRLDPGRRPTRIMSG